MTFRITSIQSPQFNGKIRAKRSSNWVTIITGVNGTGKSRLLASMHRNFDINYRSPISAKIDRQTLFEHTGVPSKIIAQTFSPFSKFPPIRSSKGWASAFSLPQSQTPIGVLLHGEAQPASYLPIGFHRSGGVYASGIIKKVIEDVLVKVCAKDARQYPSATLALTSLGYEGSIEVRFAPAHFFGIRNDIFYKPTDEVRFFVERIVDKLEDNLSGSTGVVRVLAREIKQSGAAVMIDVITSAIATVGDFLQREALAPTTSFFKLDVNFSRLSRADKKLLREALVLRRCGFLNIDDFFVQPIKDKSLPETNVNHQLGNKSIDVDELSSGQLQIIGTMLSLATMVEDNSLVLIDEPELSLHPSWQLEWLEILNACLKRHKGCHVIVATHSPLIVSDAYARGLQVISLDSTIDEPVVSDNVSVEEALTQVFSTPVRNSSYLSSVLFEAISLANASPDQRNQMLSRLRDLLKVYKDDTTASSLINDAVDLLNE